MLACIIIIIAAVGPPFVGSWAAARLGEALIDLGVSRGECGSCGYDRTGLVTNERCPECELENDAARACLDQRRHLCGMLVIGLACAVSVLFVLLGQPLTLG
jgi:hypothetical protein